MVTEKKKKTTTKLSNCFKTNDPLWKVITIQKLKQVFRPKLRADTDSTLYTDGKQLIKKE